MSGENPTKNECPAVSVIMPVYNSKQYLKDAVDSILAQTFDEFELILIDDGSTDGSAALCDTISAEDERIKVIHKQNGGICSARNAGLDAACGEYIAFCDNDDKYLPDLLKDNYALAKEYNADIVRFKRLKISQKADGRVVKTSDELKRFAVLSGREEIGRNYALIKSSFLAVWTGLYKRRLLKKNHIRFPEFMKFGQEDGCFNFDCYMHAQSIVLNPKIYYYWLQRDNHSTTGKFHKNLIESMLYNMKKEWKLISYLQEEHPIPECYLACVKSCMIQVFGYIDQKKAPYGYIQKAGILREVCNRIPDLGQLHRVAADKKLVQGIIQKNGFFLYYYFKKEGIEW